MKSLNRVKELLKTYSAPFSRFSLFLIYFWFGGLKLFNLSPANPLVSDLLERTLPFITFDTFIILLAVFEVTIGVCFLIPKLNKLAFFMTLAHLFTTFMPLILLPQVTWDAALVPTLEGQYIIKNLLILAIAISLYSEKSEATL